MARSNDGQLAPFISPPEIHGDCGHENLARYLCDNPAIAVHMGGTCDIS